MRGNYALLKRYMLTLTLLISTTIIIYSCKKDHVPYTEHQNTAVSVEEARQWLQNNRPGLNLNQNWNNPIFINAGNGNVILKIRINESLSQGKTWVLRDIMFQKDSIGNIEARGYKVFVDTSYFANKVGANEPGANKRDYIDNDDFTGRVVVYTIDNNAIKGVAYLNGKVIFGLQNSLTQRLNASKLMGKAPKDGGLDCIGGDELDMDKVCEDLGTVEITATRPIPNWYFGPSNPGNSSKLPTPTQPIGNSSNGGGGAGGKGGSKNKIITTDTSITNNANAKCALLKLVGKNVKFDSLVKAFTGDKYNLKFSVKNTLTNDQPGEPRKGETVDDPNNPNNIQINLRRSFVNNAKPIEIAKTLLHEAFHANLIQRAYEVFGNNNISTWRKSPGKMELNELIDIFEAKLDGTTARDTHHAYMAKNVAVIARGLEQFAKDYDANYSNNNYYDYLALAYQGLTDNSYFEKNIMDTQIYYLPGLDIHEKASTLFNNKGPQLLLNSIVDCNK